MVAAALQSAAASSRSSLRAINWRPPPKKFCWSSGTKRTKPPMPRAHGHVRLMSMSTIMQPIPYTLVDVQSSAVISVEPLQGVQLPLTANEEQRALALVQADNKLWTSLADGYQTITGEALAGLDQLQVKSSVFHATRCRIAPIRPPGSVVSIVAPRCYSLRRIKRCWP